MARGRGTSVASPGLWEVGRWEEGEGLVRRVVTCKDRFNAKCVLIHPGLFESYIRLNSINSFEEGESEGETGELVFAMPTARDPGLIV